jgi:hypothetical protein
MKKVLFLLKVMLAYFITTAQQQKMDTIILFDYRENPPLSIRDGRGFGEDYLQIIINNTDTVNLDAKEVKRRIRFTHKIYYNKYVKGSAKSIFDNIELAGLQVIKPLEVRVDFKIKSYFHHTFRTNKSHEIDTTFMFDTIKNHKIVLWNIYDFEAGVGEKVNYFYPRYTLHNHNWPTPQQWANYRKRGKVLRQIENAIVYRYNTTTRQITKS